MKITIELEIGVETGCVRAGLDELVTTLNESQKLATVANPTLATYIKVAERLSETIESAVDKACFTK